MNSVRKIFFRAVGYLLLGSGLIAANHHSPTTDLELGKKIYSDRCKACHGDRGDGQTFATNALNPPPKNFTTVTSRRELTRKRMTRSITQGRPGTAMMPWKDVLSKNEIRAVVGYIRMTLMELGE
jgi:cytochrome c oxidase cbb3-type subunit 3